METRLQQAAQVLRWNRFLLVAALAKAAIAGAGIGLAALASIDIAIATLAIETMQAWQVDQLVNKAALVGGMIGIIGQIIKLVLAR